MEKIRILNIDVLDTTRDELLASLRDGVLVTPNIDHLVKLQTDRDFYDVYRAAEWVVCDSRVLQLCSRLTDRPFREAIPGLHLVKETYEIY